MQKRWKVVVVSLFVVGVVVSAWYCVRQRAFSTLLEQVQQDSVAAEQRDLAAMMADTYGGTTPEEVLQRYIEAVEGEDYGLAARYFTLEKIDKEFIGFLGGDRYTREVYLQVLRQLQPGTYSEDGMLYTMRASLNGPDFFARFRKYPNNLWKIIEL